jgi:3-oxoacyl-[acyl-carrier protein] reductase
VVTVQSGAFSGQVAIVTGAGEGIGLRLGQRLVAAGARVVLNDLDAERAAAAAAAIGGDDVCAGVGGDVADLAVTQALVDLAVDRFGRLDIAVANAGITKWSRFLDYEPDDVRAVLDVNLFGSFFLAQRAARRMQHQGGGGRILLMSSVTGLQAIEYLSVYGATKAALRMLARQLVVELGPLGITVNVIAPGATITPRNLADDPEYERVWGDVTPTGRPATVDDIAEAALFLLSPAAAQITGQTLVVDGGWSATSPVPALDFVDRPRRHGKGATPPR